MFSVIFILSYSLVKYILRKDLFSWMTLRNDPYALRIIFNIPIISSSFNAHCLTVKAAQLQTWLNIFLESVTSLAPCKISVQKYYFTQISFENTSLYSQVPFMS